MGKKSCALTGCIILALKFEVDKVPKSLGCEVARSHW